MSSSFALAISISRGQFRAGLKTHLFNQTYISLWERFVLRVNLLTDLLTYLWNSTITLHFGMCGISLGPSFGHGLWLTGENTAAIGEVCQGELQDDIQCDTGAAWSRLARSEWSSARPQTGFTIKPVAQDRHWTCGRWSWPDWFIGCG